MPQQASHLGQQSEPTWGSRPSQLGQQSPLGAASQLPVRLWQMVVETLGLTASEAIKLCLAPLEHAFEPSDEIAKIKRSFEQEAQRLLQKYPF